MRPPFLPAEMTLSIAVEIMCAMNKSRTINGVAKPEPCWAQAQ